MPSAAASPVTAAIALGSNLGDRAATLASAIRSLALTPGVEVLRVARPIETPPVGPGAQGDYLNSAATVRTLLNARALLERLHSIERAHGRDRSRTHRWGPRTLDLDLIIFAAQVIDEPGLHVPHPRLAERAFVLVPLAEIASELVVPTTGRTIGQSLAALRSAEKGSGAFAPEPVSDKR